MSSVIAALTLLAPASHPPARANAVAIKIFIIVIFLMINIVILLYVHCEPFSCCY
jgi:hypothetical protein